MLSMHAEWMIETLQAAIVCYGKCQIINSDQGGQFTCKKWVEYLKNESIQISMDGKAIDNV